MQGKSRKARLWSKYDSATQLAHRPGQGGERGLWEGQGAMKFILLVVPCILALWVSLYNGIDPRLGGFPLFYWVQLLLVPLSALFILAAYKGERR